jgi:hypothetical protein
MMQVVMTPIMIRGDSQGIFRSATFTYVFSGLTNITISDTREI